MIEFLDKLHKATGLPRDIFDGTARLLEIRIAEEMPWTAELSEDQRNQLMAFCFRRGI